MALILLTSISIGKFLNYLLLLKFWKREVSLQLLKDLKGNQIYENFKQGFRQYHSTETSLIRETSDLLRTADQVECSILILLALSAAFNSVDHSILIDRLQTLVGISGTLKWFNSYLSNRRCLASIGDCISPSTFKFWIPPGVNPGGQSYSHCICSQFVALTFHSTFLQTKQSCTVYTS